MTASVCLDDETVARMVAQALVEAERAAVLAHLDDCDDCRSVVAEAMQLADETRTLARRYRLEGELGRGGMGLVYRAHDAVLDRTLAIKLLPVGSSSDATARARLVRESRALARLRHRNVVAIHDAGWDGAQFYVAMEYVPGVTLRGWLDGRERSTAEILGVFTKAARGLAAAHTVGVIHRDFKPENVLVDRDDDPKVADFGLARWGAVDETQTDVVRWDGGIDGLTRTGAGSGTPAYMPPEQVRGESVDARADVFALCVSLWEALFGVRPFTEVSTSARLAAIERRELVVRTGRAIDPRLRRLLARGLAFDRGDRFATMGELVDALAGCLGARARRRRRALSALAGAAMLGAVVLVSAATQREPCRAPDDRLAAAWSPAAAARVEDLVFRERSATDAQRTWSRMRPAIDGVVAALDREALELCEAQVAGALRPGLAANWAECVDHERIALAYRLERAGQGDLDAVHGVDLGRAPAWCRAVAETHRVRARDLSDPNMVAGEVAFAEADALMRMGRGAQARVRMAEAVAAAESIPDPLLAARARLEQGRLVVDPADAVPLLAAAARESAALGEHDTAALAWIHAGFVSDGDDPARCLAQAQPELAAIEHVDVRAAIEVEAAMLAGRVRIVAGDPVGGRAHFERAQALARDHAPAILPDLLFGSTLAAWADGDLRAAIAHQRELVDWHERTDSPHGSAHARALWNLSDLLLEAGDLAGGIASIERAHAVLGPASGLDFVLRQRLSEAELALRSGDEVRTESALAHAEALLQQTPASGTERGKLMALRGAQALARGDATTAAAMLEPAIVELGETPDFGMDGADATALRIEALQRSGRATEALALADAMLPRLRTTATRLPERGRVALAAGWALHALDRTAEADERFVEALSVLADAPTRARAEVGRRAIAHAHGRTVARDAGPPARTTLAAQPDAHAVELGELDRRTAR